MCSKIKKNNSGSKRLSMLNYPYTGSVYRRLLESIDRVLWTVRQSIVFILIIYLWTVLCNHSVWPCYVNCSEHNLSHFKRKSQRQFHRKVTLLFLTRYTNPFPLSTYYTTFTKSTCLCQPFHTQTSIVVQIVGRASYVAFLLIKVALTECFNLVSIFWPFKNYHTSVFPVKSSGDLNRRHRWLFTVTYLRLLGSLSTRGTSHWLNEPSVTVSKIVLPDACPRHVIACLTFMHRASYI